VPVNMRVIGAAISHIIIMLCHYARFRREEIKTFPRWWQVGLSFVMLSLVTHAAMSPSTLRHGLQVVVGAQVAFVMQLGIIFNQPFLLEIARDLIEIKEPTEELSSSARQGTWAWTVLMVVLCLLALVGSFAATALRVVLFSAGLVLTYRYLLDVTLAHDISLTIDTFSIASPMPVHPFRQCIPSNTCMPPPTSPDGPHARRRSNSGGRRGSNAQHITTPTSVARAVNMSHDDEHERYSTAG